MHPIVFYHVALEHPDHQPTYLWLCIVFGFVVPNHGYCVINAVDFVKSKHLITGMVVG